ncbi:hypothetical protein U5817_12905 [Aromatoleum evansii]|uniref:Uncharacterized protein n=1 Tax=Aromatoleum evansii TaxID=59406 RepID=A0ABZ1AE60_AROEV|nr:hypothetical protein U5817_12905 [Aromatoleum evansii]
MSLEKPRPRSRRSSIETEEERAWVGFYRRVGRDPAIATEVMAQLESDPEMKRTHLALYLCCKESLRRHKARQGRHQRIGQFVRRLCRGLFVQPWRSLQTGLRHGRDVAVECLPEVTKEPAVAQVHRLAEDGEFATAHATFEHQATGPAPDQATALAETKAARAA